MGIEKVYLGKGGTPPNKILLFILETKIKKGEGHLPTTSVIAGYSLSFCHVSEHRLVGGKMI